MTPANPGQVPVLEHGSSRHVDDGYAKLFTIPRVLVSSWSQSKTCCQSSQVTVPKYLLICTDYHIPQHFICGTYILLLALIGTNCSLEHKEIAKRRLAWSKHHTLENTFNMRYSHSGLGSREQLQMSCIYTQAKSAMAYTLVLAESECKRAVRKWGKKYIYAHIYFIIYIYAHIYFIIYIYFFFSFPFT